MNKIVFTLLSVCLFFNLTFSQTYSFNNNTPLNFTNATAQTATIAVSGVPAGKVLRQVNLKFGDGTMYAGDLTRAVITLTDPSGTVVTLINQASFNNSSTTTDADRKYINITLRDHAELYTPGGYASTTSNTVSNAYPYNFGYWRVPTANSYGNFTGSHNGNWTVTISFPGLSTTYTRKYISSQLVFGDPFVFEDIRTTKPNQSCSDKYCLTSGKIILGTNAGYPNPQSQVPMPSELVGLGCSNWDAQKNNAAWFKFTATSTTVKLSISGMSNKQESIVVRQTTTDCCSNFAVVTGGCFSSMYNGIPSFDKYFKQNYASGYSQNHGYTLTGLTVGEEYTLIIDGSSGSQSNFYIEAESGVSDDCKSSAPTITDPLQSFCSGATVSDLQPSSANISWYANASGGSPLAGSTVLTNGATYYAQDNTSCNNNRTPVTVTLTTTTPPTASVTQQPTCAIATGTITVSAPANGAGITYTVTGITPPVAGQTNA
ncbi:MAG TPA: hypothetical protein PLP27_08970, partial [Crocinitomicaceae bacterium]|nr:hypothetical protein [Crocinitomicaceae bacterium]